MSKSQNESTLPPPSYDQIVEIDNPTAPALHQTFSGSIFGTSTVVTLELPSGSYPIEYTECFFRPYNCDYSLVIRDFLGCVQAKANVSGFNTTLQNVTGNEILRIRSLSEPAAPKTVCEILLACTKEEEKITNTFEVLQNNEPLGLIKYAVKDFEDGCLSIHHGNSAIVAKTMALGDFVIFRDSSSSPLCNIQISDPRISYDNKNLGFETKIIFHPETGITREEQLLCTAAAIAIRVSLTERSIKAEADVRRFGMVWGLLSVFVLIVVTLLFRWIVS